MRAGVAPRDRMEAGERESGLPRLSWQRAANSPSRAFKSTGTRARGYVRVSTLDQGKSFSPANQREAIREYAKAKGYTLGDRVHEDHETGLNPSRKDYRRLLDACEAGEVDVVVVYRVDRLGRDELELGRVYHDLKKMNVRIESVTEGVDFYGGPFAKAMYRQLGIWAELERDIILERTGNGRARAAQEGYWHCSRAPYGYRRVVVPNPDGSAGRRKTLEPHPQEAPIVRALFMMYLAGLTMRDLADRLNRAGVPYPGYRNAKTQGWSLKRVSQILGGPVYAGYVQHRGSLVEGRHQALVPPHVWNLVAHERARPERQWVPGRRPPPPERLTGAAHELAQRLYGMGASDARIARELGVHRHTVERWRRVHDLPTNRGAPR